MRDIKELLKILLDKYKNNSIYMIQSDGLCWAIQRLCDEDIILLQEGDILSEYLYHYKPEWAWDGYWWTIGDVPPRIKFLKQLIEKL